jgi:hypothetical protein
VGGVVGLSFDGAHHRTLMDDSMAGSRGCAWATTDGAILSRQGHGQAEAAEVGACTDLGEDIRLGIGTGASYLRRDQPFGGLTRLKGNYILAEGDYRLSQTPVILSVLGLYGRWDARLVRGFGVAGTDTSAGETHVDSYGARLRLDWWNAFRFASGQVTPSLSYSAIHGAVDAYQETGGTAPAAFSKHGHTQQELRLAAADAFAVTPADLVRVSVEYVHRFDRDGGAVTVTNVLGATTLANTYAPGRTRQNWGRLGLDYDHHFSAQDLVSLSAHASSSGEDSDYSFALGYRRLF